MRVDARLVPPAKQSGGRRRAIDWIIDRSDVKDCISDVFGSSTSRLAGNELLIY